MTTFLSALPFVGGNPDSITRRDRIEVGTAVAKLSFCWTVTERRDHKAAGGTAQRYLIVELHSAIGMPAFRLHRYDGVVVLSEIDDTGTWLLGQFGTMADALTKLRQSAMARFAGIGATFNPNHVAAT